MASSDRQLIFISHANPADNDFTTWLGGRLSAMGFSVWADLQDLKGGSKHWSVIEHKIRADAAKVLVVTSRASRQAEGVDNEINIAKGIEKELAIDNFIIQLKIDDLPYSQLPPALNNRLAIPFEGDWGDGLRKLVKQLQDENIPRGDTSAATAAYFSEVLQNKSDKITATNEPSFASWLPISLPGRLHVYTFPGVAKIVEGKLAETDIPASSFGNNLISFALPDTIAYAIGEPVSHLRHVATNTESWYSDSSRDDFAIQRKDRRRAFNGLLNAAWEAGLRQRGFVLLQLSNEHAHFLPSKNKQPIKQAYTDPMGRNTRPITLAGSSRKYASLWHAAISARSSLFPTPLFAVRLHVAFTDNGIDPIADGKKAFRLRKSFCKLFWNDRWRRILFALLTRLTDDKGEITFATGGDEPIKVNFPLELQVPYSIATDLAVQVDESEEIEELSDTEELGIDSDSFDDDEDIDNEP